MGQTTLSPTRAVAGVEAPTLALIALTYAGWVLVTLFAGQLGPWVAVPAIAILLAQHSSLQHEVIHGHPFGDQRLNDLLVFPAVGLLVPFERFRAMHLAHHHDPVLTDPYEDPESNYLDPAVWARLGAPLRLLLGVNNTLLGRMVIGPVVGMGRLWTGDAAAIGRGDRRVARAYLLHALAVLPVALWLAYVATVPFGEYLLGCWLALSVLRIRTFLEHRADARVPSRSVIIEDRGPLSILFLNNNFHAVHHAHPNIPWYRLPQEYAGRREEFLRRNGGYKYRSYGEVFLRHLLRRKDPVAHPIWTPPGSGPDPR